MTQFYGQPVAKTTIFKIIEKSNIFVDNLMIEINLCDKER